MPRRRPRQTDPEIRYRNMLEARGLPGIAGLVRVADQPTGPLPSTTSAPGGGSGVMVIDLGDSAVYTGWSKPYHAITPLVLGEVVATLTAPSTAGEAQMNVYRNGDENLGTLTIPVGEVRSNTLAAGVQLGEQDYWQVLVGMAGTEAAGLTVYGVPG